MKIFGLTIITTKKYKKIVNMKSMMNEKIMDLMEENAELRKQLIYHKTWNQTFTDVIFPNTDERGLGEQEVPVNFPDLW